MEKACHIQIDDINEKVTSEQTLKAAQHLGGEAKHLHIIVCPVVSA